MPDPMTEPTTPALLLPEREGEIRSRAQAATPGPWSTDGWEIFQGTAGDLPDLMKWIGETCRPEDSDGSRADAEFIAHAREDVPALLAELDRVRAQLNQAHDDLTGACLARWEEEQDNARLRLALASAQRVRREARNRTEDEGPDREAES